MAKVEKKAKEKTATEAFKYGVDEVAKRMGIKSASARVQLRNANVKKAGKSYGWNTQAEVDEVVNKLKGDKPKAAKKPEKKSAEKKTVMPMKKAKKEAA